MDAIFSPISHECYVQSHFTWCYLHYMHLIQSFVKMTWWCQLAETCRHGKNKNKNIYCFVWTWNCLLSFCLITQQDVLCKKRILIIIIIIMSTLFFFNFIVRCAAELDCSETGCQTLLGIETPRIQVLKLWLMAWHLFIFMIYLMIPTVGRTVQVRLLGLLVNKELDGLYRFDCWVYWWIKN